MIAKRSAAISKSPSALTAVMLGKEGTLKCSPGGKASKKKNSSKIHNGIKLEIIYRIPACIFLIHIQGLIDERRFVAFFDPEEESLRKHKINKMIFTTLGRLYREVTPLCADLEEPKTPILINTGVSILIFVEGAKTL
jgi:hypothetical protein